MIPALLFGISLADIAIFLGRASKNRKKLYWEHIVILLIAFETIIFNWYIFFERIGNIEYNYPSFLVQLAAPLACFIFIANLLVENDTPEKPRIDYFLKNKKRIFLTFALYASVSAGTILIFNHSLMGLFPIIPIIIFIINAFYNIKWLRILFYCIKVLQIILFCIRFS